MLYFFDFVGFINTVGETTVPGRHDDAQGGEVGGKFKILKR